MSLCYQQKKTPKGYKNNITNQTKTYMLRYSILTILIPDLGTSIFRLVSLFVMICTIMLKLV